jgi:dTDP-4-amino-4,6-dideoxygalactose transaminase
MINVTKTYMPSLVQYNAYLDRIWKNKWLTNRGELTLELEEKLKSYLGIENVILMNNGTIPLQIALKLLGNGGEIITTPFSYIATSSSILWENCTPKYVDIHPEYLTIDETKIEEAITNKTTCILATHVFGNPCNIEKIESIARKYNLKVIYDAAHCFGVKYRGKSIFNFGDISTCSFHATKIFHTGEGGGFFSKNNELIKEAFLCHNFGHTSATSFSRVGINGKISELQSAMGLCVLEDFEEILKSRKSIAANYKSQLSQTQIKFLRLRDNTEWNNSYFPILFNTESELLLVLSKLNQYYIYPRRYFYPSLNSLSFINQEGCEVSDRISKTILCLPLYHDLDHKDIDLIVKIINEQ